MESKYKVDLFKCEIRCLESGIVYDVNTNKANIHICKDKELEMKKIYSKIMKEDFLKNKSMYNY